MFISLSKNRVSPNFKEMSFSNKIRGLKEIWQFDNRWQLFVSRILFSNENINIYRYKGLEILIDHSAGDANGAREVLTTPMYRQFLPEMKLPSKIKVLDLGANNGGFPLLLKAEEFEIEKLVCVEFNPNTFSRLQFNIQRNFNTDYKGLNVAVCGEKSRIEVSLGNGSTSDSIYKNGTKNGKFINIEGLTFDQIFRNNFGEEIVDICKMDVEGAEFDIFAKENHNSITKCRNLLIEIHHEKEKPREEIIEKLGELGFIEKNGENKNEPNLHYVHFFVNKNL